MADVKGSIVASVGFIIAMLLTVAGWFWIPAINNLLPITLLQAIFWVGLIINWTLIVVVTPITMVTRGVGDWVQAGKGAILFFLGVFGSMISYYILPPIIEAIESVFTQLDISSIAWIFLTMGWILAIIVIPAYQIMKGEFI